MSKQARRPGWRRWRAAAVLCLLLGVAGIAGLSLLISRQQVPAYEQVRDGYRSSYVTLLDRQGNALERMRRDFSARRDDWVELDRVSPALPQAIMLSEDKRFYAHPGVDLLALAGALRDRLRGHSVRGSSTLTMQLAGLLQAGSAREGRRSVGEKLAQMLLALAIERSWDKRQILEAYLNLVPWRGELVGIGATARALFGKHPDGLDARESALLAAMLRAPNASARALARRSCLILREQSRASYCDYLESYVASQLNNPSTRLLDDPFTASHFARGRLALGGREQASLATTIDGRLQRAVQTIISRVAHQIRQSHAQDAAAVVLDNHSGAILAYVGSSGDLASARYVDNARALRQAGSTLKPFLYAQALEQRRITAASLLDDSAVNLPTGNGMYVPQNYDKRFGGWVSARTALASSLNIPAVRLLVMVTPDVFHQRLLQLGLPLTESGDYYGYSLALGSADVTLLSLTNAYRALANQGIYSAVNWGEADTAPAGRRVMSADAAWLVGDILSDRQARARTFGLDSALSTPFWTAVKTGTSKDMRDNWTVGWSQHYTVGVWVGNSSGASMREVSGVTGAGPAWHDIMAFLHRDRRSMAPAKPADVVANRITFDNQLEAARNEYFLPGTQMQHIALAAAATTQDSGRLVIRAPADGTIIALDPDIPQANQRLQLVAGTLTGKTRTAPVHWYLNGRPLTRANPYEWYPLPGRHVIELRSGEGRVLDTVTVSVRGATLRRQAGAGP